MRFPRKVAIVLGGYVIAVLLASAAVAVRLATTSGPDAQASSGMYAAGDAMLFIIVFGASALLPTGAALYFLKPYAKFWTVISSLGVAVGVIGVGSAVIYLIGRHVANSPLATWAQFSVLIILMAPLLTITFLVCAVFAPHRKHRMAFLAATVMETTVSAYAAFFWFGPMLFNRA